MVSVSMSEVKPYLYSCSPIFSSMSFSFSAITSEISCEDTNKRAQFQIYLNIAGREHLRRSQRYENPFTFLPSPQQIRFRSGQTAKKGAQFLSALPIGSPCHLFRRRPSDRENIDTAVLTVNRDLRSGRSRQAIISQLCRILRLIGSILRKQFRTVGLHLRRKQPPRPVYPEHPP